MNFYCRNISDIFESSTVNLLPGDYCIENDFKAICNYGNNICINNFCAGNSLKELCDTSKDCNPGLFCDNGLCMNLKNDYESCKSNSECNRGSLCRKGNNLDNIFLEYGTCTPFFTLENGEIVDLEESIFNALLCKDGYAFAENNSKKYSVCGVKIESYNAGNFCDKENVCKTKLSNYNSECVCVNDVSGKGRCRYELGNIEWDYVIINFKKYLEITKNCHSSHDYLNDCGYFKENINYYCSIYKYIFFEDTFANNFPAKQIFNEYLYPNSKFYIDFCSNINIINVILVILFLI